MNRNRLRRIENGTLPINRRSILSQKKVQPIITAIYISVGNIEYSDVQEYLNKIINSLKNDKDDYPNKTYYIPVREGETRIEILNPQPVSEREYSEIVSRVDEMKVKLDEFLNSND